MLPKIQHQVNEIEIKSLGRKAKFRPMQVRDEKLLLIAKESGTESDIFSTVKQVVTNCSLDDFDVDALPLYELEYVFLRLRVQSIGGTIELSYHDNEDDQNYTFKIELDDIKLVYPEGSHPNIKVNDDITMVLRNPPAALYDNESFLKSTTASNAFDELLLSSIVEIWEGETLHEVNDNTDKDELREFIDSLTPEAFQKVQEFFLNVPHMHYKIDYKNKNGTEREIVLRTLSDFFIF